MSEEKSKLDVFGNVVAPDIKIVTINKQPRYQHVNGKWVESITGIIIAGDPAIAPAPPLISGEAMLLGFDQMAGIWVITVRISRLNEESDALIQFKYIGSQWVQVA